jgi:hypothetical protein
VDEVADTQDREEHQPYGECKDGTTQKEQLALRDAPSVGEKQWRNEQKKEEFVIEFDIHAERPGQEGAERNLKDRQGQPNGKNANDGAGQGDDKKENEDRDD